MEFVVYVLYSDKHNKTYVGYTSDLISRLNSHNKFATKGYTIKFRPWKVIYIKFYQDKKSAMNREKYLKTGTGRDFIKTLPR
ncbi:GIY-YIG nuclease family protein [Flavobacterium sp. RHBU_24]|uniref:GIY-YIG nuclease family protein n=1 Tax=Flavobacterium sp. RHBU_24 TaxID=3391185 RepID=UPI003984B494